MTTPAINHHSRLFLTEKGIGREEIFAPRKTKGIRRVKIMALRLFQDLSHSGPSAYRTDVGPCEHVVVLVLRNPKGAAEQGSINLTPVQ